ncbi:coagulation factor V isoform X2 [Amblyraja radiata]|uniref:coagulation factor V isoform X2 n=1 Tax=Amblyraja radiata TaxID=386614 RepID=UPI001403A57E|nr:coagulation factor V isoform X2 [Amblyraja radiata]
MKTRSSFLLLLFSCLIRGCLAAVRLHYIAAVGIEWVYSKRGGHSLSAETKTFQKIVYKEYHDSGFSREKVGPEWRGLLGPTLRAEVGDTLKIHFKNKAAYSFNFRPQGISDDKSAEGFIHGSKLYFESNDEHIKPMQEHTYEWKITKEVGPTTFDPQCLTYIYSSDVDVVKDRQSGLIGALLICKPGSLDENGEQNEFQSEFVLLFSVFDESRSWYYEDEKTPIKMYSINGFTNGTLPELNVSVYGKISWHLIGMSYGPEIFSVHFNGQVLLQNNHRVSSIGLTPGSSITAEMLPTEVGKWLLSSQVQHHRQAELYGFLNIEEGDLEQPSIGYHSTSSSGKIRQYFIAAEEMNWNYASDIPSYIDRSKYLEKRPNRIGKIYKKAKYVEYTDETFTKCKPLEEDKGVSMLQDGIGAPIIRGEVGDIIKIYFKNKASRPYSIYPNGITISKINEGVKYPGNSSDSKSQVEPDQIQIYLWVISENDGPTSLDPRCLTRVYHSAVDTTRDIASGLFGPLLICKGRSLDARNLQIRVDQEQRIIFAAIDENQSWYIDENIQSCLQPSSVDTTDPEFYESNIMYTINGFVYESKEALPFCEGDITYWHVFSIGSQDRMLSINFHGHTFNHRKMNEDVIHLFPLSGETVSMLMDNSGEWLLRPLSTQPRTYGMRMRIKVYQCDDDVVLHPLVFFKIEYEGDKFLVDVSEDEDDQELDAETLELLKELGMRSFKNLQENTEGEDILQFIEGDSTEHNTVAFKEEAMPYPNGTQSRTSINASKPINLTNEGVGDDLDYSEEDNIEESVKLNESSTVEPTTTEALSEVTPLAESYGSDSRPLNSTSTNTLLSHNMQSMVEETTSLETPTKDNDTRDDTKGPEDTESMAAIDSTTFLLNMNDTDILLSLPEQIPEWTLRHSNNSQLSAESASYANTADGEGEEVSASVPQGNSSGRNRQKGNVENVIVRGNEDAVEVNPDGGIGGQQEVIKGVAVKTGGGAELGLVHESMSVEDNQAIEEALIQRAVNKTENITNNGSTSEATTNGEKKVSLSQVSSETLQRFTDTSEDSSTETSGDSEKNNLFSQVSSEVPNHFTNTSEESSLESSEIREKVFIFLKKNVEDKHRVRFQGTPLKPKGNHLTYQVEERGVRVSKVKSLKRYIKDSVKDNSRQMLKTVENTRRKAAAEMMLKRRNIMKKQLSPRGFKPGMKQQIHIPMGKKQFSPRGFKLMQKHSVIYQDDTSRSIIIGVPKLNHRGTLDYDEYIANVEVNPLGAVLENEEKTDLDSVSPYTHDKRAHSELSRDPEMIVEHYLRSHSGNVRRYFIAAEEVYWDYSRNAMRDFVGSTQQRNTRYKKVIFQRYTDAFFETRYTHGEREDHLGILGPVIRAEINDVIKVMFKNLASRPYSIHAHGVSYEKSSEGMTYEDFSTDWFKSDDAVPPNATYTYVWNVPPRSGPEDTDSVCKPWVYYSSVDFGKDINSGLIGPLLICRNGTLSPVDDIPKDAPEFIFLFNTFDETKSWYLNDSTRQRCNGDCEMSDEDSDFIQRNTFHAINGFTNGSLRGLVMFEKELVRFYLINMGSSEEVHAISLDGHTFIEKIENTRHRLGVYNLYPGAFRTVELYSSKPGIWLLQCENGEDYKGGMQAHMLILSKGCDRPLGLVSGSITDSQITASDHEDKWEPKLARLHNSGMVNAWSAMMNNKNLPWIQVDLERPIVVTEISTQGASAFFVQQYIRAFYIKYSVDGNNWKYYNGNSRSYKQIFDGNSDNSDVKFNKFNPPVIARYLKLYPTSFKVRPTLRMELYGCEIDHCSHPLGMKGGNISNGQIMASSVRANWRGSWSPCLARLDMQGSFNAWRSYKQDENQWLQVDFQKKMKINGIITQGAKSFTTALFVQSYTVHFSNDGDIWMPYTDRSSGDAKIFIGNSDYYGHKKNYISPSISAQYIRIVPKTWYNGIALRVEFIGCAFK